jgi:PTH1 family peptidyl-tRNA hydrolase
LLQSPLCFVLSDISPSAFTSKKSHPDDCRSYKLTALKLIVGLGNPGAQYEKTRHNVGAVWVRELAQRFNIALAQDTKFKGEIGRGLIGGVDIRLLIPSTFMNLSGDSSGAVARFYKIEPEEILVAYDEVAFEPGVVKLKSGGGDNGHNGVKSVRAGCANQDQFHRLRIGVGHPGSKDKVNAYLTQQTPQQSERELTAASGHFAEALLSDMVNGNWQSAMTALHSPPLSEKELQEKAEKKALPKSKREADLKIEKAAIEAAKDTDQGT